mgnify:CR=1 FL=1
MRLKVFAVALLLLIALLLLPLSAAAINNPDTIAIYKESIAGLVALTKLAWCAAGVVQRADVASAGSTAPWGLRRRSRPTRDRQQYPGAPAWP